MLNGNIYVLYVLVVRKLLYCYSVAVLGPKIYSVKLYIQYFNLVPKYWVHV